MQIVGFPTRRLISVSVFDEIPLNKQGSPRSGAAFCGVTSGAYLFAYVPKRTTCSYELIGICDKNDGYILTRQVSVI